MDIARTTLSSKLLNVEKDHFARYVCMYTVQHSICLIAQGIEHGAWCNTSYQRHFSSPLSSLLSVAFSPAYCIFIFSSLYLAPSETRHFTPVPSLLLYLHLSLPLQTCRRCCPASEGIWKLRLYPGNTRHPLILLRFYFTTTHFTTIHFTKTHFTTIHFTATHYPTTLVSKRVQCTYQGFLCIAQTISPHSISPHFVLLDGITV